ncbi:chemotaxis protein CheW [Candidatus Venteria ishoeyi]|uniref:Chemotaxis protein CheW n=1 Tax=Candidatus Venteria ishoeyi TaxID=1899563 RepID=A0A1H6FAM6_9GAMM|nr:chemotaxis protein CheW [Candidatus Venteria ishoeyi]MDM8545941.1 chemotaxis protein CheW [Candidatus Venteria ishoeyi]SEH06084.1 Chemotaxis protein CheW [Candidatus Venteria ishoeyi]
MPTTLPALQRKHEAHKTDGNRYLSIHLGHDTYGIAIYDVKEIIAYTPLTFLPMTEAYIKGVLNLRGHVVPVIDLSMRLGLSAIEPDKQSCIVIVDAYIESDDNKNFNTQAGTLLGLLVSSVHDVIRLETEQLEPPPPFGSHIPSHFIQNIAQVNEAFMTILALESLLQIQISGGFKQ